MPAHKITRNSLELKPLGHKRGQTLVEYALIIAFISVVAIGSLLAMGGQVKGVYTTIGQQLTDAQSASNGGRH